MKTNTLIILTVLTLFFGCKPARVVQAPAGTVPRRSQLPQDVYGGYITVTTRDSMNFSGELIGMRNDSLVVLADTVIKMPREAVLSARVIVHLPNDYRTGGYILMGLSSLVMFQAGGYGEGPIAMGISGILYNGIGLASAQNTENLKINYYDWAEGWENVILYSRFPKGIPVTLNLSELTGREK